MPRKGVIKRILGDRWNKMHIVGKIISVTIISLLFGGFATILLGI
jgi:hypothetical protein